MDILQVLFGTSVSPLTIERAEFSTGMQRRQVTVVGDHS
jgi:hypothetical protein